MASVDSNGPQLDGGGIIDAQDDGRRGVMVIMRPEGGESAERCSKEYLGGRQVVAEALCSDIGTTLLSHVKVRSSDQDELQSRLV
jgi:hypothetical protein